MLMFYCWTFQLYGCYSILAIFFACRCVTEPFSPFFLFSLLLFLRSSQLNSSTNVSLCSELVSLEKYYEYVAYIFVAFPALLYQEPCLEVLKSVTNSRLVVELFRDIVSSVQLIMLSFCCGC